MDFGARQDNCADLLGLQTRRGSNHSAAHGGESNSRSNVLQICREFACVSSRWKVLSGEFRRRLTALAIKFRKLDRVGRRGLFEPREDFSRLTTYAIFWLFPWLYPQHFNLRAQPLKNSAGRVPQAVDCTCNQTPFNWIVSVAEDCLSPAGSFHGCSHMHFRGCLRGCIRGYSHNTHITSNLKLRHEFSHA